MPVNPRGEDSAAALRDWITSDIKDTPKRVFEIAKFQFGVSSGSVGILIAISKFSGNSWGIWEWSGLLFFVLSAAIALYITMPRVLKLNAQVDLSKEHGKLVKMASRSIITWIIFWISAIVLSAIGIIT